MHIFHLLRMVRGLGDYTRDVQNLFRLEAYLHYSITIGGIETRGGLMPCVADSAVGKSCAL